MVHHIHVEGSRSIKKSKRRKLGFVNCWVSESKERAKISFSGVVVLKPE